MRTAWILALFLLLLSSCMVVRSEGRNVEPDRELWIATRDRTVAVRVTSSDSGVLHATVLREWQLDEAQRGDLQALRSAPRHMRKQLAERWMPRWAVILPRSATIDIDVESAIFLRGEPDEEASGGPFIWLAVAGALVAALVVGSLTLLLTLPHNVP